MTEQTWVERWERRTEWPLALVAVVFLVLYSVEVLFRPHGREAHILWLASWLVWGFFVVDYIVRLVLAPDRPRWFVCHLFDLLIVVLPLMRPLRLMRFVVLVGALHRAVGDALRGRILVYTVTGTLLLIYVSSLAVLGAERDRPGANITSFGNALWWAVTTVTTVGYGDVYPVTITGRVVAALLMVGGISLIGVVTASIASWIVQRVAETDLANQAATVAHVDELRNEIRMLAAELSGRHQRQNGTREPGA